MKTLLSALLAISVIAVTAASPSARADTNAQSATPPMSAGGSNDSASESSANPNEGEKIDHFKQMVAELNLTDAQKNQIRQIRANVADRKERREQIMAILTPDQKAKIHELRQEHKNASQPSAAAPSSPAAN